MAETKATIRNLNIAPRKVRLVTDTIRGMHVQSALAQLDLMPQRSSAAISKLLKSAIANAKESKLDEGKLVVKSVRVDKGISLKRAKPRARGRATLIEKKMSNVILELEESDNIKAPAFVFQEKPAEESKGRGQRRDEKPRFKPEEQGKEKAKRGFRDRIFRRRSV